MHFESRPIRVHRAYFTRCLRKVFSIKSSVFGAVSVDSVIHRHRRRRSGRWQSWFPVPKFAIAVAPLRIGTYSSQVDPTQSARHVLALHTTSSTFDPLGLSPSAHIHYMGMRAGTD